MPVCVEQHPPLFQSAPDRVAACFLPRDAPAIGGDALGTVFVERIWAVHDVGRIINPLAASSQVEGGILQGLGYALSEERILDPTTGAPDLALLTDLRRFCGDRKVFES